MHKAFVYICRVFANENAHFLCKILSNILNMGNYLNVDQDTEKRRFKGLASNIESLARLARLNALYK